MAAEMKIVTVAMVLGLVGCSVCMGGSIWARGSQRSRALFTDDTAREVGDVLTVVIDEKSNIDNTTNRKMDKTTSRDGKMAGTLDLANVIGPVGHHIFNFPNLDFSSSSKTNFDGGADYDTKRSFTDKIPVVIEDVEPNGNLVLLGSRTRTIAGETQVIEVSGLVRPSDIAFDNTVKSSDIAQFQIVHKTVGQEDHFTQPGWLGKAFNWLNPF